MELKLLPGYELVWHEDEFPNAGCGDGGSIDVDLVYCGSLVKTYRTCKCGRGCGNKDCVVPDFFGSHDTDLEEYRADIGLSQSKRR